MATSLQMLNQWQQVTLADWAQRQDNVRLAMLWKQLTVAISYYKPEIDNLDIANAIAARLEVVRMEITKREEVYEETFEPSPWYKSVEEKTTWTLTDFTKLPPDTEFSLQTDETVIKKQDWPLDMLLQPLDTIKESVLPDPPNTEDVCDPLLNLDKATMQGIQDFADDFKFSVSNELITNDTVTDPYEAYRIADNDLSGLPIISCRLTFSAADIWPEEGLDPLQVPLFVPFSNHVVPVRHATGLHSAIEVQQKRGPNLVRDHPAMPTSSSTFRTTHVDLSSTKRKAGRLGHGVPGASRLRDATENGLHTDDNRIPMPKLRKTTKSAEMHVQTTSLNIVILRVLGKKKGKWLVEYTADVNTCPVRKTKWLTSSQATQIPQTVKDEYHKRAWQEIANKIAGKIEQDRVDGDFPKSKS